ncbi:MAG: CapA family protein [Cyclobacteriaceae bacterium]
MKEILFILVIIFFASCKPGKQIAESQDVSIEVSDSSLLAKDSIYLITINGDTLADLNLEVDLTISRLLPDTVSIAAVGDIMMGTNFPNKSYLPKDSGKYLWNGVREILNSADITFGNLEGTILNEGGDQKECNNPKLCYLFRSPEYLTGNYKENGFDLMSLANNHVNDFGEVGRLNTQRVMDSLGIGHAGSVDQPFIIKKIGHVKVGFCAFAPNRGTMSIHQTEKIKEIIQHLDSMSDIVVASFHAGAEGAKNQHVTRKREFYYGEDRGNVYELSHLMIDAGADVVVGHGPHVVRAMEVYKGKFIAYSLGNFLTYGRFNLRSLAGEAPLLVLKTNARGDFIEGQIHAFRQSYSLGPRNDVKLSAIKTIQRLSLDDFPNNQISIDDLGRITYFEN